MRARALILAVAMLAAAVVPALAGTVMEMTQKNTAGEPTDRARVTIDGSRLRMDLEIRGDKPANSVIFRGDREELMLLDHGKAQAMVIDRATLDRLSAQLGAAMKEMEQAMAGMPPEQRKMMEQMMQGRMKGMMESAPPLEVSKTSETGTTNGYPWVRYEMTRGGDKFQDLLVTDWSNLDAKASDFEVFQEMAKFFQSFLEGFGSKMPTFAENPFNGSPAGETELTSVKSEDVAGALFENPGYKVQKIDPSMMP